MSLNTLTVGQPLVGEQHRALPRSCITSQYPHSRAASCRPNSASPNSRNRLSQYPHSRAASCRVLMSVFAPATFGLNTLTVGQPLVGAPTVAPKKTPLRLNTLTVGQPLVGGSTDCNITIVVRSQYPHSRAASCRVNMTATKRTLVLVSIPSQSGSLLSVMDAIRPAAIRSVSIPSQSGSLLSEGTLYILDLGNESQYPHSRAASCRDGTWNVPVQRPKWSQYPHSRAASCRLMS